MEISDRKGNWIPKDDLIRQFSIPKLFFTFEKLINNFLLWIMISITMMALVLAQYY